jgi:hypothetical protein
MVPPTFFLPIFLNWVEEGQIKNRNNLNDFWGGVKNEKIKICVLQDAE